MTLVFAMIIVPFWLYHKVPRRRLSGYELFLNSLLPVLFHYILKLIDYNSIIVVISIFFMIILTIGIYILQKYCKVKKVQIAYYARHIVAICILFIIIPCYLYYQYEKPTQEYISALTKDEVVLASKNTDEEKLVNDLHNIQWNKISIEEKSSVILRVIEYESGVLGVDVPKLEIKNLDTEVFKGMYSHENKTITLNSYYLGREKIGECLSTAIHELYHSYEHSVIDITMNIDKQIYNNNAYFEKAVTWCEANDSYIQDRKTPDGYENNALEVDARDYAKKTVCERYGFVLDE